ncbi:MAG: type II toxin-antitoxin system RelE/ParE family toxin [Sedimentisphaerales bacterium]|nr:type II toxin-antitoxin system RelE/ParE family toxin [Sedimentisphaerales bacterium]
MAKVFRTDIADEDLLDIWLFIAEDSIRAADKWIHTLESKCKQLAENPRLGRLRKELAPNLRSFPVQNYILFYQPVDEGIVLIRVLHGSRDIGFTLAG